MMIKPCPKCKSTSVAQRIYWEEVTRDLLMHVECGDCRETGVPYCFGKQGREYSNLDFERAEHLSILHWNSEAHRESEDS